MCFKSKITAILALAACLFPPAPAAWGQVSAPVLKWSQDCSNWNCDNGWYSSPAVADLDADGDMEAVYASYHLFALDGSDGAQVFKVDLGGRCWPGVIAADLDGSGDLELAVGDGGGGVRVFDHQGASVWTRTPSGSEIRGLSAADLNGDGRLELIAAHAASDRTNTWVYNAQGDALPGWPQLNNDSGYAAGVYNDNIAAGDLDGDGVAEVVVPSDVHYICAYEPSGQQVPANAMYDDNGATQAWGAVGVWESLDTELRGWGRCDGQRAESYRTNFAHGPAALGDVNAHGGPEVIVTGNVYDCSVGDNAAGARYTGVYIFNADRGRFKSGAYNWEAPPTDTGDLLSNDYNVIENNQSNPALADLDGDGELEIIFAAYDGRVHAFWLDKTEHGGWPFSVYNPAEGVYRFATEPVVADLDNDGYAEVIFASWPQKGSNQTGHLFIVGFDGGLLHQIPLPAVPDNRDWNGALAAPTLADIDGDADLEVLVNTRHTGLVAYDLPNTGQARVLWATGRGGYLRNGAAQAAAPAPGDLAVSPANHDFGQVDLNESSPPQPFTVTNQSAQDRVLGGLSIGGPDAAMFVINDNADECSGQTLAAGQSCSAEATFTPASAGAKSAVLVVPSDDPDKPEVYATLSGSGNDGSTPDPSPGGGGGGGGCFISGW
jgi:hypothetical protein